MKRYWHLGLIPLALAGYPAVAPLPIHAGQIKLPIICNGSGAPVREWNSYVYRVNPVSGCLCSSRSEIFPNSVSRPVAATTAIPMPLMTCVPRYKAFTRWPRGVGSGSAALQGCRAFLIS